MLIDSLDGENGAGTLYAMEVPGGKWLMVSRKSYIKQPTLHKLGYKYPYANVCFLLFFY